MTFSERLDMLIEKRNTTQKLVAEYAGVRYASLSDWKKNGAFPRADIALKTADFLNISVDYLLTGEDKTGYAPEIMDIAQKIAALSLEGRQDILDFVEIKLKKYPRQEKNPMKAPQFLRLKEVYLNF